MHKSSPQYLKKLENLFKEGDFRLRYEKGSFRAGHCVLLDQQMVVINKFYTLENKINALMEMALELSWQEEKLSPEAHRLLHEIRQITLKL
jgi:hypothetical protein